MIEKLIDPITNILDKFIADKDLKSKLQHELNQELHKANMAQVEINKIEASHRSIFVAGWRPFLGWSLSFAMAWHYVLAPLILFIASFFGYQLPQLPEFDMASLMTVLMGMLGLGGLRTVEKINGVAK
tara:strand:- start:413 stop:796 length:384 start_codon:yes stop_codon:yes gene_type:complete